MCLNSLRIRSQASRVERAVKNGNELNEHWHAISIGLLSDIQERLKEQAALSHELNKKNVEENFSSPSIQNMARSKVTAPPGIPASSQDCDSNCSCRCHMGRKPKWCRLELLYGILGSVIINRGESSHCNDASCVQSGSKHDKLVYSTPRWLAEVFMMAFLKVTDVWPTISLPVCQTVNIVDTEDSMSVIALAKTGSLPELKIAIANRPRAVFDVWHDNGFSALHIAAIQGSPGMVAHLISRGADPFLEDHWGVPAIFECYQRILRGNDTPEVKELLAEQLRLSVFFEDYDFSHIHFVVLGIRSLDLHTELNKQEYKHKVNDRDGMGMTPLHWASIRGDADAVRKLLDAGADANIPDKRDRTPLYEACQSNSEHCVRQLLDYGADINARYKLGYNCFHAAVTGNASRKLLELLLHSGADINDSENVCQVTPLARAVAYHRLACSRHLLDLGADLENSIDSQGNTPLLTAVYYNSHDCIRLLMSRGANCTHRNERDESILHRAAQRGDERTLTILASSKLRGLVIDARDCQGMTAREYFGLRTNLGEATKHQFDALFQSLRSQEN